MLFSFLMRRLQIFAAVAGLLCVFTSSLLQAENWRQWRGPTSNGISTEKNIPTRWSATENVAWKLKLPGRAGATPAIWEDNIFLTSVEGDTLILMCVGTDGKEKWRRPLGSGNRIARRDEGDSASPSPSTDGKHVWAMMTTGDIACFDFKGNEVWKLNMQDRYGKFNIQFGMASTPIVEDDRIYFQFIHGIMRKPGEEAFVVALNKLTGEEIWKKDRKTGAQFENKHSYASPMMYRDDKQKFLVTHGADYVVAYQLSDGKELWRFGGLNPHDDPNKRYHPTLRFVSSPATVPGMIVVPTAKNGPVFAIRPDGKGDITNDSSMHIWSIPRNTPDVPSPLIFDGLVYLCNASEGILTCMDAKTGKVFYKKRMHEKRHRSSPVYADGHVYLTARDGRVTVVKAGRKFKIVAQNDTGDYTTASPAISNGTLYLRGFKYLWAFRN